MRVEKPFLVIIVGLALMLACSSSIVYAAPVTLKILYFGVEPGYAVAKVASGYEKATGGKVKVETELPSYLSWYQKWLDAARAHEYVWDLMVIDSQWIGIAVDSGSLLDLTDELKNKPFVKGIPEKLRQYYMADPTFRGRIWSVPLDADLTVLLYRKDLFDDKKNQAAFKKKYGYDLEVPDSWDQLRDAAEFFNNPSKNFYGFTTKWDKYYDEITWDFNQVLWAFGGEFWNPDAKKARGYIDSPIAVEAMEFYKSLTKFAPPEGSGANITIESMNKGRVAMAVEWASFTSSVTNPAYSSVSDKVGFAVIPKGSGGRFVSLGGQPMTVSAYSPHKKETLNFIEWFYQEPQLWMYAEAKGHPAYEGILKSERFWKILPQNKTMWESVPYAKDIWNIAPYPELLEASQELLSDALRGAKPIKQALDELAGRHQTTLDSYYK
jgi:multiple sugar transport system substrate-binding protein